MPVKMLLKKVPKTTSTDMHVQLEDVGKRFNTEWIFRNVNFQFDKPGKYAITGPNGSGKSTLLLLISGYIIPSQGVVRYLNNGVEISNNIVSRFVALAAPYLELIEEMTLSEFLQFHFSIKPKIATMDFEQMAELVTLRKSLHKQIRYYSSGMKQRVKLAQAFFSDVPVMLLDEPLTNLDSAGTELYYSLIENFGKDKLVIVSSNDEKEYTFCNERIHISDFK